MTRSGRLTPYVFILPAAAIYGVFLLLPLGQTAVMSFWKWDGLTPDYQWVGLDNYVRMLGDESVWSAALNNAKGLDPGSWTRCHFGYAASVRVADLAAA